MSESVYRVTEMIGASPDSWEGAARKAVETAARTVRDLRVAEATRFDVTIQDGKGFRLPRASWPLLQVRGERLSAASIAAAYGSTPARPRSTRYGTRCRGT
jgi:dodecin